MELKPEHHNPAFYENTNVSHTTEVLADEDADDCEEYDEDSNSLLSNQSSCLQNDPLVAGNTTGTASLTASTSLLVNPAAAAAVAASTNDKVRKSNKSNKTTVKKTQSPAPPIATRKATSYIGVSGSLTL